MNRRNFLSFLAGLPVIGRLVPVEPKEYMRVITPSARGFEIPAYIMSCTEYSHRYEATPEGAGCFCGKYKFEGLAANNANLDKHHD